MAEGVERYDVVEASASGGAVEAAIADVVDAATLSPAFIGDGPGAEQFAAAYDAYRTNVADELGELARIGFLVRAMMDGVDRRVGEGQPAAPGWPPIVAGRGPI